MSSGSGSPGDSIGKSPLFSQRRWRMAGVACLAGALLMVIVGSPLLHGDSPWWFWLGYGALFFALVIAAVYIAILDLQFTKLKYRLGQREIFLDTLGSEDFREELRATREARGDAGKDANDGNEPRI